MAFIALITSRSPPCQGVAGQHVGATRALSFNKVLIFAGALTVPCVSHAAPPSPERQRELIHMVRQDCGSCHGMTLKGGLGPSLLPDALGDKPAEALVATIYSGRPGTPMPPWHRFLTEDEARWVVEQLLNGFPD
ncbi:MAG: cytochrome c [Propionivibrio sp.]|uniref:Cytochrome c n=1 Tax=Candidatus Propionivibrio dominans TaxID=2954373 RepID=A0A9D7FH35_9RHOO|nr:cytochrome c [Candidatus Propionivibrio dominans]